MPVSFQERSLWISLISTLLIFGYYFVKVFSTLTNPDTIALNFGGLLVGVLFFISLIQIVLQSIVAGWFNKEASDGIDERHTMIELRAGKFSRYVNLSGTWAVVISFYFGFSVEVIVNIALFFFVLSEIVGYIFQLNFYRRGF
ncbi:MAG: hypothetical protein U9Q77_02185 [Candidatus Marinimicrobia bacterium]|nr:hypothetical protein [Candidatus Neomarinimicrobiota bacterium]